jgi:hypothetical protein
MLPVCVLTQLDARVDPPTRPNRPNRPTHPTNPGSIDCDFRHVTRSGPAGRIGGARTKPGCDGAQAAELPVDEPVLALEELVLLGVLDGFESLPPEAAGFAAGVLLDDELRLSVR